MISQIKFLRQNLALCEGHFDNFQGQSAVSVLFRSGWEGGWWGGGGGVKLSLLLGPAVALTRKIARF